MTDPTPAARAAGESAAPLVVLVDETQQLFAAGAIQADTLTAVCDLLTHGRAFGVVALHTINSPTRTVVEAAS